MGYPVDLSEFAKHLNVPVDDSSLVGLFKMHQEVNNQQNVPNLKQKGGFYSIIIIIRFLFFIQDENSAMIDFKKYLLAEYILQKAVTKEDLVVLAFKV